MKQKFIEQLPDKNICLLGLQGSRALGLAQTNDADYDYRGIYIAKNEELLSINNQPKETIEIGGSKDDEMDLVLHEVGKFFRLAMKGNPSVLMLFFVPKFNIKTDIGDIIVKNKNLFLSGTAIRNAFGGYALSQALRLKRKGKFKDAKKREKHLRHCFRLFDQGQELLETGHISLPLKDPQKYIDISHIESDEEVFKLFEERDKEFKACKSVLSEKVDNYLIDMLLLKIRGI